jgi:hypothetical protein
LRSGFICEDPADYFPAALNAEETTAMKVLELPGAGSETAGFSETEDEGEDKEDKGTDWSNYHS